MKSSIQKILLCNLLLAIIIITMLTAAGIYYLNKKNLYIMLFAFPLSGLLIWIIISRGFNSINRITKELANRAPNHLEPVSIKDVPEEIKPVIDELNKLLTRLKEGFVREKRFAADAAHELRTPLAALKIQAQVALNTTDVDEKNRALQKLITGVNRGTHIVQQLLTMSKLFPDVVSKEEVDLAKITREILAMHTPLAIEKQIQLEFDQATPLTNFKGNPTTIGILVNNLVDNAIRYCNQDSHVFVRVYQQKNNMVLEVRDDGPGIPRALRSRVFERFFRVLGNKAQGSGLGLSIVKQICELHHGRVTLKSPRKGKGLIVSVFFPTNNK